MYTQTIILGLIQGITELFPISSLGHSVILPAVLHWNINQDDNAFLIFLVATHLVTSIVLFIYYRKEWVAIIGGVLRSLRDREIKKNDTYAKLGWYIVVASIPAGILGLLFEHSFKKVFSAPLIVAIFLIINGFVLYGIEIVRTRSYRRSLQHEISKPLSWSTSLKIGFAQCLALLPGFSRTGVTLGAGILSDLSHEDAAHFSFLLATPIIFAAAVLKLPELLSLESVHNVASPTAASTIPAGPFIVGLIATAIAAFISIEFLTKYFKTKTLKPFAFYCVLAGAFSIVLLLL